MPRPKPPAPKSFKQLTTKQQNFFLEWQKHGFAPDKQALAAMEAGYNLSALAGGARSAINAVSGNEKMQAALRKAGVNYDFIAKGIKEKTTCERPVVVDKTIQFVPDNANQIRALEFAATLKDARPAQKVDINERRHVEIYISQETIERGNKALDMGVIDIDAIESEFVE